MANIQISGQSSGTGQNTIGEEIGSNRVETWPVTEVNSDWQDEQEADLSEPDFSVSNQWRLEDSLIEKLLQDRALEESIFRSLRRITQFLRKSGIPFRQIRAYLEADLEESGFDYPVICVESDVSSVEEWNQLESDIEDLIRESETEEVMIYTYVESVKE